MADEMKDKRESGQPGGGAGRKDEVGGSGVYPMSGPHPPGKAPLRDQASWGQGERGAAGYEDHGGSELTYEGGQLLGGLNTGPGGEPRQSTEAGGDQEIPHAQWREFLDHFSRQHMDWLVTIEIGGPEGRRLVVEQQPLKGISFDSSDGKEHAYVEIGDRPEGHLTHTVEGPTRITLKQTEQGRHQGVEIASADGSVTYVRFRVAASPDMLDDVAA